MALWFNGDDTDNFEMIQRVEIQDVTINDIGDDEGTNGWPSRQATKLFASTTTATPLS